MKIDDKIKKIKPYLLSIRYKDDVSIVDVKLKDGWVVPKAKNQLVGVTEYEQYPNTYIFYSEDDSIGVDDIITYVDSIVQVNIEREKKLELLSIKKNELASFFTKHSVAELKNMKFVIEDEDSLLPEEEEVKFSYPDQAEIVPEEMDEVEPIKEGELVERKMDEEQ